MNFCGRIANKCLGSNHHNQTCKLAPPGGNFTDNLLTLEVATSRRNLTGGQNV